MQTMRLDHISYAAGPGGLHDTANRIGEMLGEKFNDGGVHPRFGTRNMTLPLAGGPYLEVVEVLDHPAADKVPFGQAVRARSELGGGWMGWVVAVEDLPAVERRLGRKAAPGNRTLPTGVELRWHQIGIKDLQADPQLPFFVSWVSEPQNHPGYGASGGVTLTRLEIAGDPQRVTDWLGASPDAPLHDVDVEWAAPHGTPGLVAARFDTPNGAVRI